MGCASWLERPSVRSRSRSLIGVSVVSLRGLLSGILTVSQWHAANQEHCVDGICSATIIDLCPALVQIARDRAGNGTNGEAGEQPAHDDLRNGVRAGLDDGAHDGDTVAHDRCASSSDLESEGRDNNACDKCSEVVAVANKCTISISPGLV